MYNKKIIIGLLVAGFIIRLIFIAAFGDKKNPEMYEHGLIARNLIKGYGLTMHWPYDTHSSERLKEQMQSPKFEGAFLPPANPYILYFSFKLLGDRPGTYLLLMIINATIGTLTLFAIFKLALLLASEKEAIASLAVAVLYLPSAFAVTTFSGSVFFHLFAVLTLYAAIKCTEAYKFSNYMILGLLCGIMVMFRSEFLGFGMILFLILLINMILKRKRTGNLFKSTTALFTGTVVFLMVITPWAMRNYYLFQKFVPVVSHPWHEIWRGNNKMASGGYYGINKKSIWVGVKEFYYLADRFDSLDYNQNFELASDSILKEEVIAYVHSHPMKTIELSLMRILFLWSFDPYTPRTHNAAYLLISIPTIFLFIFGAFIFIRRIKAEGKLISGAIIFSFFIFYTIVVATIHLEPRYQVYILNTGLPLTGIGLMKIGLMIRKGKLSEPGNS